MNHLIYLQRFEIFLQIVARLVKLFLDNQFNIEKYKLNSQKKIPYSYRFLSIQWNLNVKQKKKQISNFLWKLLSLPYTYKMFI